MIAYFEHTAGTLLIHEFWVALVTQGCSSVCRTASYQELPADRDRSQVQNTAIPSTGQGLCHDRYARNPRK